MNHFLPSLLAVCALGSITQAQGIKDLRGINAQGELYGICAADGSGNLIGSSGLSGVSAMARRLDWLLYVATSNGGPSSSIYLVDVFDAEATFVTSVPLGNIRALAFRTSNELFAIDDPLPAGGPDELHTIDLAAGTATLVGPIGFSGVEALAYDWTTFYGWDIGDGSGNGAGLITIDPSTGAGTDVNPAVGGSRDDVQSLGYSSWHNLLYGAWDKLYLIDRATGEIHGIGAGDGWGLTGLDSVSLDWIISCTAKPTSLGCAPMLSPSSTWVSKSGAPATTMIAGTVPGGAGLPGILLYSKTTIQPVQTSFGQLCLSAFQRAGAFPASPGGNPGICDGHYTWDLSAIASSYPSIAVGDLVWFQAWYRDSGFPPPGNANLTNAVGPIIVQP
jgi:hypothetical protein